MYFPKGFPKWQLSKDIFPSVNFTNVQFPTQHLYKSILAEELVPQPVLAAVLGPL